MLVCLCIWISCSCKILFLVANRAAPSRTLRLPEKRIRNISVFLQVIWQTMNNDVTLCFFTHLERLWWFGGNDQATCLIFFFFNIPPNYHNNDLSRKTSRRFLLSFHRSCHFYFKSNQIIFYLYSPKSQSHCLNGLYNLYSEWHPLS